MKILVLTQTFLPLIGGAELLVYEVFRRLAARHTIKIVTPEPGPEVIRQFGGPAGQYPLPFAVTRYNDTLSLMHLRGHRISGGIIPPFSLSAITELLTNTREFAPDIIAVFYMMPTGAAAFVAGNRYNVPVVLNLIGRDVPGPGIPWLWKYWHRLGGRFADETVFVSQYCRDMIYGPGIRTKGVIIPAGVNLPAADVPADTRGTRDKYRIPRDHIVLLAVQRLSAEKRVDLLLAALKLIISGCKNVTLLIVGKGTEQDKLEILARQYSIEAYVRFLGYVPEPELTAVFRAADIFVFNSTYETFGIAIAQAMSYGLPVVSVRSTAIPELVETDKTGLLVDPGSPDQFARAVNDLIIDPVRRKSLGIAARAAISEKYRWDTIARDYEIVFRNVIAAKQGRPA